MIHLTGKDSFVIYHDNNSRKNKLFLGKWASLKSLSSIKESSFICNVFDKESYVISGGPKNINDEITIQDPILIDDVATKKKDYLSSINQTIEYCKTNVLEKCIISRIVKTPFESHNYYHVFQNLCNSNKEGFKYLLNHPTLGMWMGISPETLLHGSMEKDFYTQALAGSKLNKQSLNWTDKEIQEHQFVVEFIKDKIKENGILNHESATYDKLAGEVVHLNKDFKFSLKTNYFSFIDSLHPTPAIAGIPLDKSIKFISDIEPHERSFYSGYLGLVDSKSCELYVNLRCARISSKEFQAFVGGGITKQSQPIDEYNETQIKSQTILTAIKKR
jgi:isochorismate synthase